MTPRDQRHPTPEELEALLPRFRAEAGPDAAVRHHVADCDRCRRELERLREVDEALTALPAVEPSPGFTDAVMARVRLPVPWYRRLLAWIAARWTVVVPAGSLAAASAALGLWIFTRPGVTPGGVLDWTLTRISALFWNGVVELGRLVWISGLPATLRRIADAVQPLEAAGAMALLSLTTAAVGLLMARLLTTGPRRATIGSRG